MASRGARRGAEAAVPLRSRTPRHSREGRAVLPCGRRHLGKTATARPRPPALPTTRPRGPPRREGGQVHVPPPWARPGTATAAARERGRNDAPRPHKDAPRRLGLLRRPPPGPELPRPESGGGGSKVAHRGVRSAPRPGSCADAASSLRVCPCPDLPFSKGRQSRRVLSPPGGLTHRDRFSEDPVSKYSHIHARISHANFGGDPVQPQPGMVTFLF